MFERFTDRARRVVVLAQEEARMLNHNYIGTEHILWVPRTRSPHATCTYSWMRPPSRSRRSGRTVAPERGGVRPAGGC